MSKKPKAKPLRAFLNVPINRGVKYNMIYKSHFQCSLLNPSDYNIFLLSVK